MNPTIITARITDQHLQLVNEALIASGGVDVLQIRFEFCGLWDGCGRTAVFYRDPATVYHVPVVDCLVTVPSEMLADEGAFYFGVMGTADNVRTTEVVKVKVVRGAITAATATPEAPAPDIYDQLIAAYGQMEQKVVDACAEMERGLADTQSQMEQDTTLMHARLDEAIAMRSTNGGEKWEYHGADYSNDDPQITGTLTSNGAEMAVDLYFKFINTVITPGATFLYYFPPQVAPLMKTELDVNINILTAHVLLDDETLGNSGNTVIKFTNTSDTMSTIAGSYYRVRGTYPLASVSISELADVRVGADGTVYPTAGDAVRAQVKDLVRVDPSVGEIVVDNAMSDTSENVPKTRVVKAYVDRLAIESAEHSGCFYRTVNGVTEWLNPPMMVGTEYRTVERNRGKPVYVQEFAVGTMPSTTYKTYNTPVSNLDRILSASLVEQGATSGNTLAYATSDIQCYAGEADNCMYISIAPSEDGSSKIGFVTVKYTKTTD